MKKIIPILIILACLVVPADTALVQPAAGQAVSTGSSLIHFNKSVFSWTDRVYITIYAPDFNSDPNLIDEIGVTSDDKITVSTNGHSIPYHLVETGTNTGIFSGYVTLTGDPTIKGTTGVDGQGTNPTGIQSICNPTCGPTNGFLPSTGDDGISVSFEYNRDQVITGSALIKWNVGQIKWLAANYPIGGQAILQITDPDMNLNPDAIDKFDTSVWSDSDSGGIKVSMTETGPNTDVFQGTVYLTSDLSSSGSRLHVSPGDTVTGEYTDTTLPSPHSPSDQMRIVATTTAGSVPPLEQASSSNAMILDSTGNPLTKVNVNQQVHIVSDVTNNQDKDQPFAYLMQIQDNNGITVSLSWITGSMTPHQTMNLGQSWMPTSPGRYTAQIFVWQSITDPNALATPSTLPIQVR